MATLHYLPIRMSFKLSRVTLHETFTNNDKTSCTTLQQTLCYSPAEIPLNETARRWARRINLIHIFILIVD